MSWDVAVEILEGRSEYNSWEYAYIRDAIRNNCSKGSQKSELIYYKKARKYFLQHSLLRAFCVLFCEWKEGTIIANDSHLRGDTMLNIYFGDMPEAVYNTSVYFNYTYEDEWLTSDFAKEVIKKIDKSDVKGPHAVESPVLGVISPEKLSGGTKTLLLMANDPEKVFNASTCGDNCAPFILKLAKKKDLTINLRHLMDFGKKKFPVDVKVLNTGDVVHSMEELMPIAFQFV